MHTPLASSPKTIAVIGAHQYDSTVLLELLQGHAAFEVLELRSPAGARYTHLDSDNLDELAQSLEFFDIEAIADHCDYVCLALPNGLALNLAPPLVDRGCRVLDLSADFRLRDFDTYRTWFRTGQTRATLPPPARTLGDRQIAYGLPELYRSQIKTADLVACPGSVATAVLLGLAPLLRQGLIDADRIVIDVKVRYPSTETLIHSILSNEDRLRIGRSPSALFPETIAQHPQISEIEQVCSDIAGRTVKVHLSTYGVPVESGLLATLYAPMRDPGLVNEDLLTIYKAVYKFSPWVDVLAGGKLPTTASTLKTNHAVIGLKLDGRTDFLAVAVALDETLKGRVGQVIQCLNIMLGEDEKTGLA